MTPLLWAIPLQVISVLEDLGVRHHVGGSFASSIHGIPRQTRDLDVVAELVPGHVASFAARLQAERLDLSYLRTWATPLDVADLLDRALSPEHGTANEDGGR